MRDTFDIIRLCETSNIAVGIGTGTILHKNIFCTVFLTYLGYNLQKVFLHHISRHTVDSTLVVKTGQRFQKVQYFHELEISIFIFCIFILFPYVCNSLNYLKINPNVGYMGLHTNPPRRQTKHEYIDDQYPDKYKVSQIEYKYELHQIRYEVLKVHHADTDSNSGLTF